MKLQCSCGAKYEFEVTPEMRTQPVSFVCSACGLDASDFVNDLIRRELGADAPAAPNTAIAPPPATAPRPASPPQVRLHRGGARAPEAAPPVTDDRFCARHPGLRTVARCVVCQKAICPKCMEILGYVCSPLCKQQAELQGIAIPEFAAQRALVERRRWRRIGLAAKAAVALALVLAGFWIWYLFVGSQPRPVFSVRFAEPAYSGGSRRIGEDQIVFLHGDTLARHDLKAKKEIWSRRLVDPRQIERAVEQTLKSLRAAQDRLNHESPDAPPLRIPAPDRLAQRLAREAAAQLELHVSGRQVWVSSPEKLVRYDWETGQPAQELPWRGGLAGAIPRGDEMWMLGRDDAGQDVVTRLNLATGQTRLEKVGLIAGAALAATKTPDAGATALSEGTKALDPAKVAESVPRMSLPQRVALPAVLSVARNQERALAEMRERDQGRAGTAPAARIPPAESFDLIPAPNGFVQFSTRLLESRIVTRTAMKPPPRKSALDGPVSVTATAEVANEILNEMQRERGGDTVEEDESRYLVTVRLPGARDAADWAGEVIGPPALHPLQTVNVVTAGKSVIVLDHSNRKQWQANLGFNVQPGDRLMDDTGGTTGLGPCVERDGVLFVMDEGVLTAFELATGEARWRLPSVGISSMFFDDQGMIYVNSTTAGPESLQFSRQIDVTQKTAALVLKLDPRTGKILWTAEPGGPVSYLDGRFIYTLQWYQPDVTGEEDPYSPDSGLEARPFLRIKRLDPKNGRVMWEHFQQRAPWDVRFEKNVISLVFKKEVQVLKFLSW